MGGGGGKWKCTFFYIYPLTIMTKAVIYFQVEKCPAVRHSSMLVTFSHWNTTTHKCPGNAELFKTPLTRANCSLFSTIFVLTFEGRVPKHINICVEFARAMLDNKIHLLNGKSLMSLEEYVILSSGSPPVHVC